MADRWPTRTSQDYNCEVTNPACRKRRLLGTHQWRCTLLVVGLSVTEDWFEMGCHLSPSLISIRLTACRTSISRKRRSNHKQQTIIGTRHSIGSSVISLSMAYTPLLISIIHLARALSQTFSLASSSFALLLIKHASRL